MGHFLAMNRTPPTLDMRLDGSFREPARTGLPISAKLMLGAVAVALVAGTVTVAALAIWVLSMALPVLVAAGLVFWGTMRFRRWQMARRASTGRSLYS